jgi:hypothetical protein
VKAHIFVDSNHSDPKVSNAQEMLLSFFSTMVYGVFTFKEANNG